VNETGCSSGRDPLFRLKVYRRSPRTRDPSFLFDRMSVRREVLVGQSDLARHDSDVDIIVTL